MPRLAHLGIAKRADATDCAVSIEAFTLVLPAPLFLIIPCMPFQQHKHIPS